MRPESFRVLIADDMPAVRAIVRDMLEAMGFRQFHESEDGASAWRTLYDACQKEHSRFHLVISDWLMPGMDGLALVQKVRGLPETRAIPFLMVTSQSERHYWQQAEAAGVSGFIVKPFDPEQLRDQLLAALSPLASGSLASPRAGARAF
ncbi:MAG: hypothetical protein RJB38_1909 [Pseudomonadota bacterium]|jgi:two-component system chemotaxis response regulator CheY